jgi:hypothetical protein
MVIALIFIKINYGPEVGEIVVGVDASLEGYGGYLGQRDLKIGRVCPA